MTTIQPIGTKLLLQLETEQTTTNSGILLSAQNVSEISLQRGKVIKLGTAGNDHIKEGDTVLFKVFHAHEVEDGGESYYIVEAKDILTVFSN